MLTLADYVASYVDALAATRYRDLPELQPPPFATLAHGAAGTAYALWRTGHARAARRWLAESQRDRRRAAWRGGADFPTTRSSGFMFGRGGLRWVQACTATRDRRDAIRSYLAVISPRNDLPELANGRAGQLVGAVALLRRRTDDALAKVAGSLAAELDACIQNRGRSAWQPFDAMRFAHGWSGVLFAALAYRLWRGEPVPPWLTGALEGIAEAWSPTDESAGPGYSGSWCNGAAGATLLWIKCFEATGDRAFLAVARRAGERSLAATGVNSSLCCGDSGIAYSLLALHRVEPDAGWRTRATELAASAVEHAAFRHPSGLFYGHPGLVCLALDVTDRSGRAVGFPGIEC